jgi:membrane protein YdbS with pleckstrin-like domain
VSDSAFSNEPVDVSGLPQLAEENFVPVHPNFLRVSLIGSAIFAVIVLAIGVVVTVLVPSNKWIPILVMAVLLAFTALSAALKVLEVRNIAYQVRQHDLSYRNGVLVKTVQTVPFVRVQHARVAQGPVQRAFGLATLAINSAGPDLNIAGLGVDDAERLRALVVERAGELVEES